MLFEVSGAFTGGPSGDSGILSGVLESFSGSQRVLGNTTGNEIIEHHRDQRKLSHTRFSPENVFPLVPQRWKWIINSNEKPTSILSALCSPFRISVATGGNFYVSNFLSLSRSLCGLVRAKAHFCRKSSFDSRWRYNFCYLLFDNYSDNFAGDKIRQQKLKEEFSAFGYLWS